MSHGGLVAVLVVAAACAGGQDDSGGGTATSASGPGGGTSGSTTTTAPPVTPTEPAPTFSARVGAVTAADLHASWRPGCPLSVERLRAVDASFWGFDGQVHEGRIVVADDVVDDVVGVLADLFTARYPIERMEPVDVYGGSADASVDANNTSAFNCRRATGGSSWSQHAYGRAVDLNPLLNPYVDGDTVLPPQSERYLDRSSTDQGVIHDGDPAVVAFESRGWVWGGRWRTLKDYQHFSRTGR